MIVHVVDGTYEPFRHFYGLRRFTKGKDRPFGAVIGVLQTVLQMLERAPLTSALRPIMSSNRFAKTSGRTTRRARASSLRSSGSSTRWRRRSPPWASPSGRWSSSRLTTRSPRRHGSQPAIGACRKCASGASTRIWRSASATIAWSRWTVDRAGAQCQCLRARRRPGAADLQCGAHSRMSDRLSRIDAPPYKGASEMEMFLFARLHARPGLQRELQPAIYDVQAPTRAEPDVSTMMHSNPSGTLTSSISIPGGGT